MTTTFKKYKKDLLFLLVLSFIVLPSLVAVIAYAAAGSFSPSSVNFGNVAINGSADRQIVFTNTSPSPISGSVTAGPGFTCIGGGCSYNLGVGDRISPTFRFTPTSAITYNNNASFTSAAGTNSVACSATRTSAPSTCTLGPEFQAADFDGFVDVRNNQACNGFNYVKVANGGTGLYANYEKARVQFNGNPASRCVIFAQICAGTAPPPSCSDGIQNQDETGIDCGGVCGACAGPSSCTFLRPYSWSQRTGGVTTSCLEYFKSPVGPADTITLSHNQLFNGIATFCPAGGDCSGEYQVRCDDGNITPVYGECRPFNTVEPPPPPTCSDGIQNQDETGIDCGGVCGSCAPPTPPPPPPPPLPPPGGVIP